jgi:hypothetical protein
VEYVAGLRAAVASAKPGTFLARLEFQNVVVVSKPKGCIVKGGVIRSYELKGELVEQAEKVGTGIVEILLRPRVGGEWAPMDFERETPSSPCWPVELWKEAGRVGEYPILRNDRAPGSSLGHGLNIKSSHRSVGVGQVDPDIKHDVFHPG